uniref:Uncharacterized protein n=1 Tax=Phytophthora fragariae TaxID=53985 RepID=A0A6A3E587_9STRA|nr:hypothetical protein PF009_g21103 [Phytophthora fragariae]
MGMVELSMEFEKTMTEDFKSVAEIFQKLRNRHILAGGIHLGEIETKLKSIFGNKSKAEIQAMGKTTQRPIEIPVNYAARGMAGAKKGPMKKSGKRKTMMLPTNVEHADACFFCKGVHNDTDGIGPHFMKECPMRKEDMAKGVGLKYIFSEPRLLKVRKTDHARVQKMQPAAPKRKENPVDAAVLQRLNINEPMASDTAVTPTGSPNSPVVSSSAESGSEDDIDEFDGKTVVPANSVKVTAAAEELEEKAKAFGDTDADMD